MAGPWTISRDQPDGEPSQDLRALYGRVVSGATRAPLARQLARAWAPGGRPGNKAWWAVPLAALMTALVVLLTWGTVSLAQHGLAAARAAASIRGGPLIAPAPRTAGALPRRFGSTPDPADQLIITQLEQRFAAVSARLVAAAGSGRPARPVTAIRPAGLYGEPGHLDPLTSRPSWVMYLGLQSSAALGQPIGVIGSLMLGVLGRNSKIGPWPVAAGHRGGQANCTIAWLGRTEVSVCGWATDRTIGLVASPARETSVAQLATLMIPMRYDLQRG